MLPYGERRHNEQLHLLARIPPKKIWGSGAKIKHARHLGEKPCIESDFGLARTRLTV